MKSTSIYYSGTDTRAGVDHIVSTIEAKNLSPSLMVIGASCIHDLNGLRATLAEKFDCAIHGATSCLGVMTNNGHSAAEADGIGVFVISDEDGEYGAAAEAFETSPREAAKRATQRALLLADREGEVPELIWVASSPGAEEEVLGGICGVVGEDVPVIGGSAADNSVEGNWVLFDRDTFFGNGVVVTVMFPSNQTADVFQNGYSPTDHSGVVTKIEGRRIYEIDGRPAAEVLNEWTDGEVMPATFDVPTAILSESTLWPLGSIKKSAGDREEYILIHPSGVNPDMSVDVFANVEEGQRVTQMTGTKGALIARAGQVATLSRSALEREGEDLAGALVVFCGGCMLAVRDRVDEVTDEIREALGDAPFLGVFTFGEQGRLQTGGNLMISCLTFGG